jgi:uncharacterized UBP type Zn finger protein
MKAFNDFREEQARHWGYANFQRVVESSDASYVQFIEQHAAYEYALYMIRLDRQNISDSIEDLTLLFEIDVDQLEVCINENKMKEFCPPPMV